MLVRFLRVRPRRGDERRGTGDDGVPARRVHALLHGQGLRGPVTSSPFPTYSAAYLGNGAYTGVSGRPALYQTQDGTTTDLVLSDIAFTTPSGEVSTAFSLVGADAESTDARESITWRSSNPIYSLTAEGADPGIGNACNGGYTGIGGLQVTCSAASSAGRKTGTPIVASKSPSEFSQQMIGGGRQAIAFGVMISQVELNKSVASRFAGDDFEIEIRDEDGRRLSSAGTGPAGSEASTGSQTIIAADQGATVSFSELARSGSLDRYDISWACTRNGQPDPSLPTGYGSGASANVKVGIGDFVSCTITNSAKPTSLLLQKHAGEPEDVNGNGIADAGDRIRYTFDVTNTGELPLRDLVVEDPKVGAVTCPAGELAPGGTVTCAADEVYTATPADQAGGAVRNTATASATLVGAEDTVASNPSSTVTPLTTPAPGIDLVKIATPHDQASFTLGREILYSFVVTNTGNVPLDDVSLDETEFSGDSAQLSAISCPSTSLAPDRSMTCTATYILQQADIDRTELTNAAVANGEPVGGGDPVTSPEARVTIPGPVAPAIGLEKSVAPAVARSAGDTVTYTFHVTNHGNVTLSDPRIDEASFTGSGGSPAVICPPGALAPGASVDCTAEYTVTQADVDAGAVSNTATATATPSAGSPPVSAPSDARVVIPPTTGITLLKTADTETYSQVGQIIRYAFEVKNLGNVSLHGVSIAEREFTGSDGLPAVVCPDTVLAGGQSMRCEVSYTVTQADLDSGEIVNSATASGTPAGADDPLVTAPSDVTVTAQQAPALSLVKTADVAEASIGDTVQYRFAVTNTGNVSVSDPVIEELDFSGSGRLSETHCPQGVLAPGATVECTAVYTVVGADGPAGSIENTAVATAQPPAGAVAPRSNESSAEVRILFPAISLQKSADRASASAGDTIVYRFAVTNIGNVVLTGIRVEEVAFSGSGKMSPVVCPETPELLPGATVTCSASYRVVAADLTGEPLTNTAKASGDDPSGNAVGSDPSRATVVTIPASGGLTPTGASGIGLIVAGAAVLLALGIVAVLLGRRRRKRE